MGPFQASAELTLHHWLQEPGGPPEISDYGCQFADAGDLNGDGYADIVVAGCYLDEPVYIHFGNTALEKSIGFSIYIPFPQNQCPAIVSGVGDVNGDGFDDIAIGVSAIKNYANGSWYNEHYNQILFYFGDVDMDNQPDQVVYFSEERFLHDIEAAGDVNGDGYQDVLVSAKGCINSAYNTTNLEGYVYVFHGGPRINESPCLTFKNGSVRFPTSMACAGDVNSDGYSDILVGCNFHRGNVYLYLGGQNMDARADLVMQGETSYYNLSGLGSAVSGAGDVNGDGFDDFIVGAPYWDAGEYEPYVGRAYLYFGGASMDAYFDAFWQGKSANYYLGYAVSDLHDINGDGFDEFCIEGGWPYYTDFYIYSGGSPFNRQNKKLIHREEDRLKPFGVHDLNGDHYNDFVLSGESCNWEAGGVFFYLGDEMIDIEEDASWSDIGKSGFGYPVSGGGDLNGDGFDDYAISDLDYYKKNDREARTYVYYGGDPHDDEAEFVIQGDLPELWGITTTDFGDYNGDGFDDLITYTHDDDSGWSEVCIFYGGSTMDTEPDLCIIDLKGSTAFNVGDINGDAFDDLAVEISNKGFNIYFGGSPMDDQSDLEFEGAPVSGDMIAGGGDLNGDGFDDFIVCRDIWEGKHAKSQVSIYFGPYESNADADAVIYSETGSGFDAIDIRGDLNGDGYNDLVASGPKTWSVFWGGWTIEEHPLVFRKVKEAGWIDHSTYYDPVTDTVVDTYLRREIEYSNSFTTHSDLNGDGFNDMAFGVHVSFIEALLDDSYDPWEAVKIFESDRDYITVYYGGSVLDTLADEMVLVNTENTGGCFINSMSSAGDVNGDGADDLIIGSQNGGCHPNRNAALYLGSPSPLTCVIYEFPYVGYYLVSVPVQPVGQDIFDIFPNTWLAINSRGEIATRFRVDSYLEMTIEPGEAYWICVQETDTVQVFGTPVCQVQRHYSTQGWHTVGAPRGKSDFTDPDDNRDGKVLSPAFQWDPFIQDYVLTYSIEEKNGYYIAVQDMCALNIKENEEMPVLLKSNVMQDTKQWQQFRAVFGNMPPYPPDIKTLIKEVKNQPPEFRLGQNYPNPFNSRSTLLYQCEKSGQVNIAIYNVLGQKVQVLVNEIKEPGAYILNWDGHQLPSGLYMVRFEAGGMTQTKKALILK
ncbi:FG-GAP repeat protein [bacterium]|nr:FG-GAP repeat protein [bacterium]